MTTVRVAIAAVAVLVGCAFSPGAQQPSGTGGHAGISIGGTGGGASQGPCQGLQCQQSTCKKGNCVQPVCSGGVVTRLTGKVYDPAGKVPLPNVDVFVPNMALADYTDGPGLRHLRDGAVGRAGRAREDRHDGQLHARRQQRRRPRRQRDPAGDPGRPLAASGDDRRPGVRRYARSSRT